MCAGQVDRFPLVLQHLSTDVLCCIYRSHWINTYMWLFIIVVRVLQALTSFFLGTGPFVVEQIS